MIETTSVSHDYNERETTVTLKANAPDSEFLQVLARKLDKSSERDAMVVQKQDLECRLVQAGKRLEAVIADRDKQEKLNQNLQARVEAGRCQFNALLRDRNDLENRLRQVELQRQMLSSENRAIRNEIERLNKTLGALQSEKKQREGCELDAVLEENKKLRECNANQADTVGRYLDAARDDRHKIRQLTREIQELQEAILRQARTIRDYQRLEPFTFVMDITEHCVAASTSL